MKNIFLIILCILLQEFASAQAGIITTVAGNGTTGFTGDNGPADSATFSFPDAVAVDPAGNLYISDRDNHVIRKVDNNQVITTFAGNGFPGYFGDGGQAIDAEFAAAYSVVLDKAGNLYIADETVRKIDISTGIINTIAGNGSNDPGDGGPAVDAVTENIAQITFDAVGNLYITDGRHFSIRKVDTAGIITTVAGNGSAGCSGDGGLATSAQLNMPEGVAVDAAGNIFIADFMNHNIRRVDAHTHLISTICGDPAGNDGGYTGDDGLAIHAELMAPHYLLFDGAGNLYIDDTQNQSIRKISAEGIIFTIAGHNMGLGNETDLDGVPAIDDMLKGPYGIAINNQGDLYIAEASNSKIRKVGAVATSVKSVVGNIQLSSYPNPVNDLLYIQLPNQDMGKTSSCVYNVAEQLVSLSNTWVGNKLQFNTGNLAPGMYYLKIVTGSGTGTVKFVKE